MDTCLINLLMSIHNKRINFCLEHHFDPFHAMSPSNEEALFIKVCQTIPHAHQKGILPIIQTAHVVEAVL